MYLLNPNLMTVMGTVLTFTFHYVSIKSVVDDNGNVVDKNLHSTMYLLNLY